MISDGTTLFVQHSLMSAQSQAMHHPSLHLTQRSTSRSTITDCRWFLFLYRPWKGDDRSDSKTSTTMMMVATTMWMAILSVLRRRPLYVEQILFHGQRRFYDDFRFPLDRLHFP
jgi:hypothetical protein